ncbi:MAG TPA: hypothetical protein VLI41_16720 [Phenylobacterium sp.]|uniref:hypothetical protein n=1 Tax=Phenylobacterium sp. TaxID=1871053 RepID=UPI002C51AAC5|nr:hypothetical protein [Phenylobacterium sp.]HSV04840.1 hypothetical protein [Phenylobacterium sp.]
MAKHAHAAADAAAAHAATNSAAADAAQTAPPIPPIWHWSISEMWTAVGHAWTTAIHAPYLGLLTLAVLLAVAIRILVKLLR